MILGSTTARAVERQKVFLTPDRSERDEEGFTKFS
jgi:hypothetical protein